MPHVKAREHSSKQARPNSLGHGVQPREEDGGIKSCLLSAVLGKGQGVMEEGSLLRLGVGQRELPREMVTLETKPSNYIHLLIKAPCQLLSQAL